MNDDRGEDECQFGSIMNVNRKRGQSHTFVSSNEAPEPGELFINKLSPICWYVDIFQFHQTSKGPFETLFQ